eukprot:TRINITY_DN6191_c0_g1_i4.p1 TRINITY_DN6191_c0_g1~~TRINITY_DN6191_c0_g1_i4.p1  ORF type:complete len:1082 (+),score=175.54 TRINITY_DN6191_c0_g1_i4:353-3247(+)
MVRVPADWKVAPALLQWRKKLIYWMIGRDASLGFPDTRLVQLPVCNAVLIGSENDAPVLIHNASVRTPVDVWDVRQKEDGCTVLMDAIKGGWVDIAELIIKRNSFTRHTRTFMQNGERRDNVYASMRSVDGTFKYDLWPDYVGIDECVDGEGLTPIRAAAARGMWSVVQKLRKAKCKDTDLTICSRAYKGRNVWHDLATPEVEDSRSNCESGEQMEWAIALMKDLLATFDTFMLDADDLGKLPLHWAAYHNHFELVKLMASTIKSRGPAAVSQNTALFSLDNAGYTPTAAAVLRGNVATVKVLLEVTGGCDLVSVVSQVDRNRRVGDVKVVANSQRRAFFSRTPFGPPRSALQWSENTKSAPYMLVLLQRAIDGTSQLDLTNSMLSEMHDTSVGSTYRRRFLIKHIFGRAVILLVQCLTFIFLVQFLFLPGIVTSRTSGDIFEGQASWFFNKHFGNILFENPIPFEKSNFFKPFSDLEGAEDWWTFHDQVTAEALFHDPSGRVGPHTYLLGSARLRRREYKTETCEALEPFGVGSTCIRGRGDWGNEVLFWGDNVSAQLAKVSKEEPWNSDEASGNMSAYSLEFNVVNTHMRRILYGRLEIEWRTSGLIRTVHESKTMLWMPLNNLASWKETAILCLLLCVVTVQFAGAEAIEAISERGAYLQDRDNIFQLLQLLCFLVVLFCMFMISAQQAQKNIEPNTTDFVDLRSIMNWVVGLQVFCGVALLLLTFRGLFILRLLPSVGPSAWAVAQTLVDATVLRFFLFLLYMILGVGLSLWVLYGIDVESFSALTDAIYNTYRYVWGDWDLDELNQSGRVAQFVFLVLSFVITGTLGNVFIAIVGKQYDNHLASSEQDWVTEVNDLLSDSYFRAFCRHHGSSRCDEIMKSDVQPFLEVDRCYADDVIASIPEPEEDEVVAPPAVAAPTGVGASNDEIKTEVVEMRKVLERLTAAMGVEEATANRQSFAV